MKNYPKKIHNSAFLYEPRNISEFFMPDQNTMGKTRQIEGSSYYSDLIIQPKLDETKLVETIDIIPHICRPVPDIVCFPDTNWGHTSPHHQNIITDFASHGHRVFMIYPDNFLIDEFEQNFGIRPVTPGIIEVILKNSNRAHDPEIEISDQELLMKPLADLREYFRIDECIIYINQPTWGALAKKAADKWGWKIIFDKAEQRKSDHDEPNVFSSGEDLIKYSNIVLTADKKEVKGGKDEQVVALREHNGEVSQKSRYDFIYDRFINTVPKASIIILTYNNYIYTKLCLESIIRSTEYPNYEIIIVDNYSTDETREKLKLWEAAYSNIKVILNDENFGFAKGNNQGLEHASGEYLVLLNNDTVVPPGWLSRLLRHLRDPQVGLVGPVTNNIENKAKIEVEYSTILEMECFASAHNYKFDNQVASMNKLIMFCVAMRRGVYDQIGPLDERFEVGMFEDDDYCLRTTSKNYQNLCAFDVFIHHFQSVSFRKLENFHDLFINNKIRFEKKWNQS